jgi:hypothetical protein
MVQEESGKQEQIPQEEPIKIPWYEKIPFSVKAIVFKYWFIGLDYFLFAMGLTLWMGDNYNPYLQMAILGLAMGFFDDFLLYNINGAMESGDRQAQWYEIYKSRKFLSLLINLVYGLAWSFLTSYSAAYLASLTQNGLFQEAFSWALVGLVVDALLLFFKDLPLYLVRRKKGEAIHL